MVLSKTEMFIIQVTVPESDNRIQTQVCLIPFFLSLFLTARDSPSRLFSELGWKDRFTTSSSLGCPQESVYVVQLEVLY